VGKTDQELLERLKREPHLRVASTFKDEETAERIIQDAISTNQSVIATWLKKGEIAQLEIEHSSSILIGRAAISKSKSVINVSEALIVLRRKTDGYYILTAYTK